jgi:aspartyl aminopeptidase
VSEQYIDGLIRFLDSSPSPYHAVATMAERLTSAGFQRLDEKASWDIVPEGRYFVTRNASSIIAFQGVDLATAAKRGLRIVGAHTDSPCLKIKPNPDIQRHNCRQLGVEVYGGALLNPWFDRDLSMAGRVTYRNAEEEIRSTLVNFSRALAVVPSLAIHLDREANNSRSINAQNHLPLVIGGGEVDYVGFHELLKQEIENQQPDMSCESVVAYEIYLYDMQGARRTGLKEEYIASARLDNLLSCYIGIEALLDAKARQPAMLVCTDHEEVGSQSSCGAQGPFLQDVIERLVSDSGTRKQMIRQSLLISSDNAHALHPNYSDKHDQQHGPRINGGPVIKVNANQRYATNSETSAQFRRICELAGAPYQLFIVRSDMGCGSTIGPIVASEIGVPTVDIGCPQWAMHSIRETAGVVDAKTLHTVLSAFYASDSGFAVSGLE